MLIAKEQLKGMFEKKLGKQLDTIVNPSNKPYRGSGLLMDYPLEKLFG